MVRVIVSVAPLGWEHWLRSAPGTRARPGAILRDREADGGDESNTILQGDLAPLAQLAEQLTLNQ